MMILFDKSGFVINGVKPLKRIEYENKTPSQMDWTDRQILLRKLVLPEHLAMIILLL